MKTKYETYPDGTIKLTDRDYNDLNRILNKFGFKQTVRTLEFMNYLNGHLRIEKHEI